MTWTGRAPGTRVSIVVPCLNEEKYLGDLLEALNHQHRLPDEVVVVEGGSTDQTVEVFRTKSEMAPSLDLKLVPRRGASIPEAVNVGVAVSHGDIIIRLDAHSSPSPNYVEEAIAHLQNGEVGVVGGVWTIVPGDGSAIARAIARAVAHPLGAGDAAYRITHHSGPPADVDTVPFGCFPRDLWTELGGFDESLHANEDYDFNYRTRESGRRVVLNPQMRSIYYARPTLGALATQYFRYGWWKVQMLRKHPRSLRWRQAVPAAFVAGVAMLAMAGFISEVAWLLLGGTMAIYACALGAASLSICIREGGWSRLLPMCCAFATVHFCWGGGAVLNLLTGARWPYTVPVERQRASPSSVL